MSKGIIETVGGVALATLGAAATATGIGAAAAPFLIKAGIGLTLAGIGTLISGDPVKGFKTTLRETTHPWNIRYGYGREGGTLLYINTFGTSNTYLDLVMALAAHPTEAPLSQTITLLLDKKLVQFSYSNNTSFVPAQQAGNSAVPISSISRSNQVVFITLSADIPFLQDGYNVLISALPFTHTTDPQYSAMGTWPVSGVVHSGGHVSFYYLNAGENFSISSAGNCGTTWANFGNNVYMEVLYGNQTLGQTFTGMLAGTPNLGDTSHLIGPFTYNLVNPWQATASAPGFTLVMLRLTYSTTIFPNGIPQISFLTMGKNDIYDPRLGPMTGLGTVLLESGGSESGYQTGDGLFLNQAGAQNGIVQVGAVSGTGQILSWNVLRPGPIPGSPNYQGTGVGNGYSVGTGVTVSGGHGTGAVFAIQTLTGAGATGTGNVSGSTITSPGGGFQSWMAGGTLLLDGVAFGISSYISPTQLTLSGGPPSVSSVTWSVSCNTYTQNSALCCADYLMNQLYGYKVNPSTGVNMTQLIAAANVCDEQITLAYPPVSPALTESRYTCNGGFTTNQRRSETLQQLLSSMAGRITYVDGQFFLWPGIWLGTAGTITGNQIYGLLRGNVEWKPIVPVNNLYNSVKGTYISASNSWQSSDFPPYAQDDLHGYNDGAPQYSYDENLTIDQGDRRFFDIQLPFTTSPATAQRLAKIELLRKRNFQGTGSFPFSMWAYQWTPMDILAVDLPYFGWSGQLLEIQAMRLRIETKENSGAEMIVELDVQESDPSIYAWDVEEELSALGYQQVIGPNNQTPTPPTNFFGSSENGAIFLDWDSPADAFVLDGGHIEIEYQLVQSPEGLWISLGKMDPTVTTAIIPAINLVIGDYYNVQIRSVNVVGVPSEWIVVSPFGSSPVTPGPILVLPPVLWEPAFDTPISGDPLYGTTQGFGIDQSYPTGAAGSPIPQLDTYGAPPPNGLGLTFRVRREYVSGVWAQECNNVTGSSPVSGEGEISFGGSEGTPGSQVGRILSKLANNIASSGLAALTPGYFISIADFVVIANDGAGNFTVSPDPTTTDPLTGLPYCSTGDLFTLRTGGPSPAFPLTADLTSFTDPVFGGGAQGNTYSPNGLIPNGNAGNLVLIIGGTGAGQPAQTIVSNNGPTGSPPNKVFVTPGWAVIPDKTSIIVLCEPNPQVTVASNTSQSNNTSLVGAIPVLNYAQTVVRCEAYTTDSFGIEGPVELVPFREVYLWGSQGTVTLFSSTAQLATHRTLKFNTSRVSGSTTTLSSGINNSVTTIPVTSGTLIVNGTYIKIPSTSEIMYVVSGGGTTSLTVTRGALGTTPASASSFATVDVPGALTYSLMTTFSVANQGLFFQKITNDLNYVVIQTASGDFFDSNGSTQHILPDTSATLGNWAIQAPGS